MALISMVIVSQPALAVCLPYKTGDQNFYQLNLYSCN